MNDSDRDSLRSLPAGAAAAPAIGAPGRRAMSYTELRDLGLGVQDELARCGIGANDRVAIVLPNGPIMASCFLAVASAATAAPLNSGYREAEFEFYLSDLTPKALMIRQGEASPARDVATRLGIPIIDVTEDSAAPAGHFALDHAPAAVRGNVRTPGAGDTALVLHTSGTTSRPKIVPLTQRNLVASARHIGRTLALGTTDHCLNIMPLFHIHGLIAAVLSSLASGGQVTCTPGFSATAFFGWLDAIKPSWYTAVPTMHQVILDRAGRNQDIAARSTLRLIRSSSASLPPAVMQQLEQTFNCPVIESYGMTEAAHQMTSNPLPPAARKPGSVGLAAGPEVRIMDADGRFVTAGAEGEVVIRGPNVTTGYDKNPDANAVAFVADAAGGAAWFRTGDLGVIDAEGYLSISGRIKEIINRGGEKIAPREVDDVLTAHSGVKQAVTFAVVHPKLGEDVAAAVVLRENSALSEHALRDFAADRLAGFKVPSRIYFVDEIPKGNTGKLQRIGLAKLLGIE